MFMRGTYTEDQLVEQPAIRLFAELGWQTVSAQEETFGPTGTLGRETKGEVVLLGRLRSALERLNPALPPEALASAVDEITRDRSPMLKHQVPKLRRTRDLLLLCLLSGQVELKVN